MITATFERLVLEPESELHRVLACINGGTVFRTNYTPVQACIVLVNSERVHR